MGADDTTDKLFPVPEGGHDRRHAPADLPPIPLAPSIRVEFAAHHSAILGYLSEFEKILEARLPKPGDPDLPSPASVRQRVTGGALKGIRFGAQALMAAQLAADLAHELGYTQLEGPLRLLVQVMLGG